MSTTSAAANGPHSHRLAALLVRVDRIRREGDQRQLHRLPGRGGGKAREQHRAGHQHQRQHQHVDGEGARARQQRLGGGRVDQRHLQPAEQLFIAGRTLPGILALQEGHQAPDIVRRQPFRQRATETRRGGGQHLVKDHAQGVHVTAGGGQAAGALLGRQVGTLRVAIERHRPESVDLDLDLAGSVGVAPAQDDVRRRQRAVDQAGGVGRLQGADDLDHVRDGVEPRDGAGVLDLLAQRPAVDVLGDDEGVALGHADKANLGHVLMGDARLVAGRGQRIADHGVGAGDRLAQHRQHHRLIQAGVVGQVNRTCGGVTQAGAHLEVMEAATDQAIVDVDDPTSGPSRRGCTRGCLAGRLSIGLADSLHAFHDSPSRYSVIPFADNIGGPCGAL